MAGGLPVPTERQVQRGILKMAERCFPDVLIHHSPNGAHLAGDNVARFKQMGALLGDGMKKGFPDLLCLWRPRQGALMETKRPGTGRLSTEQKIIRAILEEMEWPIATVDSVEAAHAFLKDSGAPCKGELA